MSHVVEADYAGVFQNIPRLTCRGETCQEATIIRAVWMSDAEWQKKLDEFRRDHPDASHWGE